jgi:hypothetical protein
MNRRNFLSLFSAGVAGIALEQAIPLGRVWSFPKKIVVPESILFAWEDYERIVKVGSTIRIRQPQRWIVTHEPKVTWYTRADVERIFTAAFPPDSSQLRN